MVAHVGESPTRKANTRRHVAHAAVIAQCEKPTAHSSTFGFLPTRIAQTKKPKELEFFQRTDDRNKK
jgi:hypothetical protein